ncbi:MAG: MBL fold metallo-hydrolase, partial [Candidatus Taylorbacteria bacterium CG11_big_fil_rev_8_21_14_0_20_46_11]
SGDKFRPEIQERLRKDDDVFSFPNLHLTMDARDSSEILRAPNPKIIIAGSG